MFRYKIELILTMILLFVIWGCGTMVKEDNSISVPQKVSIEMPKALQSNGVVKKRKQKKLFYKEKNGSLAYDELKDDVAFLEEERASLELRLIFIDKVIDTIQDECQNVKIKEPCKLEEGHLNFIYDDNLSKKVKDLVGEELYTIGDVLYFGKVEFTKYPLSSSFQYKIKIDDSFEDEKSISNETISWSKDENKILSIYSNNSSDSTRDIKIEYKKESNGTKKIIIEDGFYDKQKDLKDIFHLDMLKKTDIDETYVLTSKSLTFIENIEEDNFISKGELSNIGGYLDFSGIFEKISFKEKNSFDGDGKVIKEVYCYEDMECDLEDEGSWFSF